MDGGVEADAVDQLHGIIAIAVVFPLGIDGNDVGVVEAGSGLRLDSEALDGQGSVSGPPGQDLQSDDAIQRKLACAIHDSHSSPSELADDLEVAEAASGREGAGVERSAEGGAAAVGGGETGGAGGSERFGIEVESFLQIGDEVAVAFV